MQRCDVLSGKCVIRQTVCLQLSHFMQIGAKQFGLKELKVIKSQINAVSFYLTPSM